MKKWICSALLSCVAFMPLQAMGIWDGEHLAEVKAHIQEPTYTIALEKLLSQADRDLLMTPPSVMMKKKTPPSGSKHDYVSLARYFWPDPTKADGLPYINRDGETNPEINDFDRNRLGEMANAVINLSLAWYFTDNETYAEKATELLRVWFLNKDTRMNPDIRFSQHIPGVADGRCYGIIDTFSFVEMLDAVCLLESSISFTKQDSGQLRRWFANFLKWLTTHPMALEEGKQANNHSIAYDVQVAAYARFTDNKKVLNKVLGAFHDKRIMQQIEPDGKQPHELRRTLAFGYSQYNLAHIIDILQIARQVGFQIDRTRFEKGMDFLASYMGKDVSTWPYQQIHEWEFKQHEMAKDYYRAWLLDPDRKDYRRLYQIVPASADDRFLLLYYRPDHLDQAMAQAARQMRYAIDEQRRHTHPGQRERIPCTLHEDGSLKLVDAYDWRSGFFAGSLWYLYAYTHDTQWAKTAAENTWPLAVLKDHRGTHDLGFMVNDSFGKAFEMTGDERYQDIVVETARSLCTRYNDTVKCIRSWDFGRERWRYPVIIDNMMNLEMLFDAYRFTGDSLFLHVAVNHANTTMKNHFRSDASSFHVVDYDPSTGNVRKRETFQGNSDDSFWSRGQGWGVYGFTLCYRYTHHPTYLQHARRIAHFIMSLPNMPSDGIPYWDMRDPRQPQIPRDASAAAIIASALYELCTYVSTSDSIRYKVYADKMLDSLISNYQAPYRSHHGFLLLHSTGNLPAGNEIDVPLNYADYYYLEAISRRKKLEN